MRGENSGGSWEAWSSQPRILGQYAVFSWPGVCFKTESVCGKSHHTSSPCVEQEIPQGNCQCQSYQDPDCNANDGPHRETCGTSSIWMKKKEGGE